mgnify:CR=1 FL=1
MTWTILWSSFAEQQIANIYAYYVEEASVKVAKKIARGIIKAPDSLIKNPELGQLELSLIDLKIEYRYVLYKSYKIIYSLDHELSQIRIADVFDTRQNPKKLKRKK